MSDVRFQEDVEKLAQGIHSAPSDILGVHPTIHGNIARIWCPGCFFTTVKIQEQSFTLFTKTEALGLFEFSLFEGLTPLALDYKIVLPDGRWILDPYNFSFNFSEFDAYLFQKGVHYELFEKLGAHIFCMEGTWGVHFSVWAPRADGVSVVGDFCCWNSKYFPMTMHPSGVWTLFIPGICEGEKYKFAIFALGQHLLKSDPFGFQFEKRPKTASIVNTSWKHYFWGDDKWIASRKKWDPLQSPISIYEVHLGSWIRTEQGKFVSYSGLARALGNYVHFMGFTHVELLPITEHPLDESWGYQSVGYFAPTSRFGCIQDFQNFVDTLHQMNIGVIIDWVPAHFASDAHGLREFDGYPLYEPSDPLLKNHPHWGTLQFDYEKQEVSNFLIASALFWISKLHVDGFRVDAVSSMLYRDYGRENTSWSPNRHGGKDNLEAIEFFKHMNATIKAKHPGVIVIAEESTTWGPITGDVDKSLGFHFKWNMGWRHDTLHYFQLNPFFRSDHKKDLGLAPFSSWEENFLLPFSHDEVVHCKKSLLAKMEEHPLQQFAHVRLFFVYQLCVPGKKLIFMGSEWGTAHEWSATQSLDWTEVLNDDHLGVQRIVSDGYHIYKKSSALWQWDSLRIGFQWLDLDKKNEGTIAFLRHASQQTFLCVCNFSSVLRAEYTLPFFSHANLRLLLNSESSLYGGSFDLVSEHIKYEDQAFHIILPPCAALIFEVIFERERS